MVVNIALVGGFVFVLYCYHRNSSGIWYGFNALAHKWHLRNRFMGGQTRPPLAQTQRRKVPSCATR